MSEVSIAEAKNHLPRLVQQAEAGDVVRITRRGKQVAVLMSERSFERLATPGHDLAAFLKSWRGEMHARKAEYPSAVDFKNLRDNSGRKQVDWE
ncbi:MAG: type II toxin-antitoxin system Phd/YefM family antitoxin [Rhodospirillales bacterium]|jgi:prevent-host-death family protein|nr:type II toxin-antitoxin system Phd/YefM family antitoxin [Rhodospirillales bacterium]